jgi:hypothetical protein
VERLEALRRKGAEYFLLPQTASWWLDHYPELKAYLEGRCRTVRREEEVCWIFALGGGTGAPAPETAAAPQRAPATANGRGANGVGGDLPPTLSALLPGAGALPGPGGPPPRRKVLMLGVYLADQPNRVADLVTAYAGSARYDVTQCWVALGGEPPNPAVAAVTARVLPGRLPKYQILNELLAERPPVGYEFVVSTDDDIALPGQFLDRFLDLQARLDFALAQPARTGDSYLDHPIVERQMGVVARQTRFVEIGPVVSFHRRVFDLVFPFDLASPMGWGYENVWAYHLARRGLKMGIIDDVPVAHDLRKPVANYSWDEANRARDAYLACNAHLPLDECFRVVDVIPCEEAAPCPQS